MFFGENLDFRIFVFYLCGANGSQVGVTVRRENRESGENPGQYLLL